MRPYGYFGQAHLRAPKATDSGVEASHTDITGRPYGYFGQAHLQAPEAPDTRPDGGHTDTSGGPYGYIGQAHLRAPNASDTGVEASHTDITGRPCGYFGQAHLRAPKAPDTFPIPILKQVRTLLSQAHIEGTCKKLSKRLLPNVNIPHRVTHAEMSFRQ